jgi:uncharacterized cupin superfamily protein
MEKFPKPVAACDVTPAARKTIYPEPFARQVEGRMKRRLGDHFGLTNFGVNLTELAPGAVSALLHHHTKQDEFVYIVEGTATLVFDDLQYLLRPGDCIGFKAGTKAGHQLINRTPSAVIYMEIGNRAPGDHVIYPNDDLKLTHGEGGAWIVTHKNGDPY